jgi:hypothetical protein
MPALILPRRRFLVCFRVHDAQKAQKRAKNYDLGWQEMQRLRTRSLGHEPSHTQIARAMMRYLSRQFLMHWMYRSGILRL